MARGAALNSSVARPVVHAKNKFLQQKDSGEKDCCEAEFFWIAKTE